MTIAQIAHILDLPGDYPEKTIKGISIDTRTLEKDNLFIALSGRRVDGHEFLPEAQLRGAAAALVSKQSAAPLPQIPVSDVIASLGKITETWRANFAVPLIAVTGSNGKTTLKNMIHAILKAACDNRAEKVLATEGNFNNLIGLPLTLARLNQRHQYAVIEMGMNRFGEIAALTKIAQPKVAVITNAAASHLAGVGDVEGVAKAKSEIFLGLPSDGIAILNRDDAYFPFWQAQVKHRRYLSFGRHPAADIRATIKHGGTHQLINVNTPKGNIDICLPLLGQHNVFNTLAATAATLAIDIQLEAIKKGIEAMEAIPGRLRLHQLNANLNVIDDTYNANPFSLQAALQTLSTFSGNKILVLGDMKELGDDEKALHQIAGEAIRHAGINYLLTYGELSAETSRTFGHGAFHFDDQTTLLKKLNSLLVPTTTVLIKGSRSMKMENIVQNLINNNC